MNSRSRRAIASAIAFSLVGCGGDIGPSKTTATGGGDKTDATGSASKSRVRTLPEGTPLKLAFICNNASNFWLIAKKGVEKAEKELGLSVNFYQPPDPATPAKQNEFLETLVSQGYHGAAISPIAPDGQTPDLDKAAARLNLLTQDSDAPSSKRLAYVGTNNFEAGRELGKVIVRLLPNGGKVAVFVGTFSADNATQRLKGIEKELEGTKIQIVAKKEDNKDANRAMTNVEDVLNAMPDVNLLAGLWAYNAPKIAAALKARKGSTVIGVGFDEDDETLSAIEEGVLKATVVQKPFEFGYQSIKLLHALTTKGESELPKGGVVDTGIRLITKENVKDFRRELAEMRR
jgi:ribose transport system substrate-binding protein